MTLSYTSRVLGSLWREILSFLRKNWSDGSSRSAGRGRHDSSIVSGWGRHLRGPDYRLGIENEVSSRGRIPPLGQMRFPRRRLLSPHPRHSGVVPRLNPIVWCVTHTEPFWPPINNKYSYGAILWCTCRLGETLR